MIFLHLNKVKMEFFLNKNVQLLLLLLETVAHFLCVLKTDNDHLCNFVATTTIKFEAFFAQCKRKVDLRISVATTQFRQGRSQSYKKKFKKTSYT